MRQPRYRFEKPILNQEGLTQEQRLKRTLELMSLKDPRDNKEFLRMLKGAVKAQNEARKADNGTQA